MKNFVNNEILNCMNIRMASYEADGEITREEVIEKYAPRIDRVLADYEEMGATKVSPLFLLAGLKGYLAVWLTSEP